VVYRSSQCEFCCRREIVVQVVVFSLSFALCPMRFLVTLFRRGGKGFYCGVCLLRRGRWECVRERISKL